MKRYHDVRELHFEDAYMVVIIDGQEKRFEVRDVSATLYEASAEEKNTFEISPSGYGIHWPLLDEDLSIDGLLGIVHTPTRNAEKAQRTS